MNEFSDDRIQRLKASNPSLALDNNDAIDYLCRRFLIENEMGTTRYYIHKRLIAGEIMRNSKTSIK